MASLGPHWRPPRLSFPSGPPTRSIRLDACLAALAAGEPKRTLFGDVDKMIEPDCQSHRMCQAGRNDLHSAACQLNTKNPTARIIGNQGRRVVLDEHHLMRGAESARNLRCASSAGRQQILAQQHTALFGDQCLVTEDTDPFRPVVPITSVHLIQTTVLGREREQPSTGPVTSKHSALVRKITTDHIASNAVGPYLQFLPSLHPFGRGHATNTVAWLRPRPVPDSARFTLAMQRQLQ
jgi:hypothetical protein